VDVLLLLLFGSDISSLSLTVHLSIPHEKKRDIVVVDRLPATFHSVSSYLHMLILTANKSFTDQTQAE
jgi:hypothetical protein